MGAGEMCAIYTKALNTKLLETSFPIPTIADFLKSRCLNLSKPQREVMLRTEARRTFSVAV